MSSLCVKVEEEKTDRPINTKAKHTFTTKAVSLKTYSWGSQSKEMRNEIEKREKLVSNLLVIKIAVWNQNRREEELKPKKKS